MWPDKRLMELLQIEHPIIQAPMAGASSPEMAASAANAGCVGSLGCAMMSVDGFDASYNQARALTNKPVNVNFFCHAEPRTHQVKNEATRKKLEPFFAELGLESIPEFKPVHYPFNEEMAEAVLRVNPSVVSFHFGLPSAAIVKSFKDAGIKILSSATTRDEAIDLEERGIDAIIAQGWEAGGHHGFYLNDQDPSIGTFALVPQIVDAVGVPVIAAGGIADGRGIAAAFALGASGVQIGTAFLTCKESAVSSIHHQSLLSASGADTVVTKAFSGRPARGLKNRYSAAMHDADADLPDFPLMNTVTGPLRKTSAEVGSPDFVAMWAGQSVDRNRECSVSKLIECLVEETKESFNKISL